MALVNQIKNLVNDSVKDALGKNASITQIDTSDVVSLGKLLSQYDAFEGFYKSLTNRIVRTIYFIRTYEGSERNVLRDEHEYGAFVQKVYYVMPEAVDNTAYQVVTEVSGETVVAQHSPYDVNTMIEVKSLIYGGQGTWALEIIRPQDQIKSAFLDESSMMSFIDGIYITVENAFKLEEERLTAIAVNTGMASSLNAGKARNLLEEYNSIYTDDVLTVSKALESANFLRYACKEISDTVDNMQKMSTLFNAQGYETFTRKEDLVVEMLGKFINAVDVNLKADTFHEELIKLPKYEKISFWQNTGTDFSFEKVSEISVKNDGLITETNLTGEVAQGGIICYLHDVEQVAAFFGYRKTWELVNERDEIVIHGEKARKGFAVDNYANGYVFYIADAVTPGGDTNNSTNTRTLKSTKK